VIALVGRIPFGVMLITVTCSIAFPRDAFAQTTGGTNIRYVKHDANGANSGETWRKAFRSLQDALTDARDSGGTITEIWVAAGTYTPTGPSGSRFESFELIGGVAVYGGFAGEETSIDQRDVAVNETILSGDLNGDDTLVACTADSPDCDSFGYVCVDGTCALSRNLGENSYHVVTSNGVDASAILDGFTIRSGHADSTQTNQYGGGMYNANGSPTIANCTFRSCSAGIAGAMYNVEADVTITGSSFIDNYAYNAAGAIFNYLGSATLTDCMFTGGIASDGGAIYNSSATGTTSSCAFHTNRARRDDGGAIVNNASEVVISDCTFNENTAQRSGGAVANIRIASPSIIGCSFTGNVAGHSGGGISTNTLAGTNVADSTFLDNAAEFGGGMYNTGATVTVTGCMFRSNDGGGIHNEYGEVTVSTSVFERNAAESGGGMHNWNGSATALNCTFIANTATYGGGMYSRETAPAVSGCLFVGNTAVRYGGGSFGPAELTNCTVAGNASETGGGVAYPNALVNSIVWGNSGNAGAQLFGYPLITYSTVQDDDPFDGAVYPGLGNIDADPLLTRDPDDGGDGWGDDPATPDVDESANDDYGDLHLLAGSPCINVADNAALPAELTTDIDGEPRIQSCYVDMGADESPYTGLDCNGNGVPDACDITSHASGDCNHNKVPDECDLALPGAIDCNDNGVPDECDTGDGTSDDCNGNSVPDECEPDCNANLVTDECDIATGTSTDCNSNFIPDECDLASGTSEDCNANGTLDECDIDAETSPDCNGNDVPDECDLATGSSADCNGNAVPDECDIANERSPDVDESGVPDECEATVLFVKHDALGVNNGTNWHDAYRSLQDALRTARTADSVTEEIWVARGTYTPTVPGGDRNVSFELINGVALYGGFAGDEMSRDQRDTAANETILSGDLFGDEDDEPLPSGPGGGTPGETCHDAGPIFEGVTTFSTIGAASEARDDCYIARDIWYVYTATRTGLLLIDPCGGSFEPTIAFYAGDTCPPTTPVQCEISCYHATGKSFNVVDGDKYLIRIGSSAGTGTGTIEIGYRVPGDRDENSYHVVTADGVDQTSVLDGFRISGGNSLYADPRFGGGLTLRDAGPLIANCRFTDNSEAAAYLWDSSATFERCTFEGNWGYRGGGVQTTAGSDPVFRDCVFHANTSTTGGGMYNEFASAPTLVRCQFKDNNAEAQGGAVFIGGHTAPEFIDCVFRNNTAIDGGAVSNDQHASPTFTNSSFIANTATGHGGAISLLTLSSPTVSGCTFTANSAAESGGALYSDLNSSGAVADSAFRYNLAGDRGGAISVRGTVAMARCVFEGNQADHGGAIAAEYGRWTLTNSALIANEAIRGGAAHLLDFSSAIITNCTFTENHASYGRALMGTWRQSPSPVHVTVSNSILYDGGGEVGNSGNATITITHSNISGGYVGGGNIQTNPRFVRPPNDGRDGWGDNPGTPDIDESANDDFGDLHLQESSPCIGAGDNAAVPEDAVTDIDGEDRIQGCLVDMGADESPYFADCNHNDIGDACEPGGLEDCNGNGTIDLCDIHLGYSSDCNLNAVPDECDLDDPAASDCNTNNIPDECETDCNENAIPDDCDLADQTSFDCNANGVPDECDDEPDCNENSIPDRCDIRDGASGDCNGNEFPDECDVASGRSPDRDASGIPDECEAPVLFVKFDAPGHNDGTSWLDAYRSLQDALRTARHAGRSSTDIWVARGTYKPTGPDGERTISFDMMSGVAIYGGFAGDESSRDQRDVAAHETILNGDLNGDGEGPFFDIIDNSYHVVTANGVDATAILDGVTVVGGNASRQASVPFGGGILINSGGPTLAGCTIRQNRAESGGGVYNEHGNPTLRECAFRDNFSYAGGGMYNESGAVILEDCNFTDNRGVDAGGGVAGHNSTSTLIGCTFESNSTNGNGGGVYDADGQIDLDRCTFDGNVTLRDGGGMAGEYSTLALAACSFTSNDASDWGGGLALLAGTADVAQSSFQQNTATHGGGVANYGGFAELRNSTFDRNTASHGGGLDSAYGDLSLLACRFEGNAAEISGGGLAVSFGSVELANGVFSANKAGVDGGGIDLFLVQASLANCTLAFNAADRGRGISCDAPDALHASTVGVVNSIFYDDGDEIFDDGSALAISYSDVQGGWPGTSNIDADPHFMRDPNDGGDGWGDDPATPDTDEGANDDFGDLHLRDDSPCIDAGGDAAVPAGVTTDIDEDDRIRGCHVDMGADESVYFSGSCRLPGDLDGDFNVDLVDHGILITCLQGPDVPYPVGCDPADFNTDGDVDLSDAGSFMRQFMQLP